MSRKKVKNTKHVYTRALERAGIYRKKAREIIKNAQRYGITSAKLPEGPLRSYMESIEPYKRVKYYKGFIFIFCKNSTRCITMYRADESLISKPINL